MAVHVVVGGQFGSESKGRVAGHLVRQLGYASHPQQQVVCVRVGGPNAGHVVIDDQGRRWAMRQVPVGFVEPTCLLVVAAGSEVDLEVLDHEIEELEKAGFNVRNRLVVDYSATLLEPRHRESEQAGSLVARVGSTAKGIGAARADRLTRTASTVNAAMDMEARSIADARPWLSRFRRNPYNFNVVIEGTQGYGLGLHTEHYPQTTSGDCRAIDFLAQVGISPWAMSPSELTVHVVCRPNPIRVAGNSGALPGETTWEELGLPVERTTVTQNVRRVGTWDPDQVAQALLSNGWSNGSDRVRLSLSMMDHLVPEAAGLTSYNTFQYNQDVLSRLANACTDLALSVPLYGVVLGLVGTGPNTGVEYRDLVRAINYQKQESK